MNVRTWLAIAIVVPFAIGIGLWGMVFFLEAQAAFWAVIGAVWVRERWRRAGRSLALANGDIACDWCWPPLAGRKDRCTCERKCTFDRCGADDTGTDRQAFDRELAEWLKGDSRG